MGVWIETLWRMEWCQEQNVTPFVGVWIETENTARQYETSLVTPFVGVWIETPNNPLLKLDIESHPSWVCGLKHKYALSRDALGLSHPSWVCGLKHLAVLDPL